MTFSFAITITFGTRSNYTLLGDNAATASISTN